MPLACDLLHYLSLVSVTLLSLFKNIVLHFMFLSNNQNWRSFRDVVLIGHKIKYIIKEKRNRKKLVKIAALSFLLGSQLLITDAKCPSKQFLLPLHQKIYETGG